MRELILYCDESIKDGEYFSNFYGGALTFSNYIVDINETLNKTKCENNLFGEIKWTKVTEQYLDKYIAVIDKFFDYIDDNKIITSIFI